ncbi:MarR family transcriptional regulator [Streptomyces sp. NPDC088810]|uniref:MarR family transcriptional regulator n=1 Tax=Streptomyces sp. NPDC088810 TaxID=3365904 RepID=UPI003829298F
MTTTAPRADGRTIALAHYASRAVLEHVLTPHGIDYLQSIALRLTAVANGPVERADLAYGVVSAVKADEGDARRAIEGLAAAGLIAPEGPSSVRITAAGRELCATTSAEAAVFSARLYAGIPEEDRAAAGRVLSLVTERADAELAALRRQ